MGTQVYQEGPYKVYHAGHNYIVHNSNYTFSEKHTHIQNFNAAKSIIQMALNKMIPRSYPNYLLVSLKRISDDDHYIEEIESLMTVRLNKGKKLKYCNTA